jgi:hypothetical protein
MPLKDGRDPATEKSEARQALTNLLSRRALSSSPPTLPKANRS